MDNRTRSQKIKRWSLAVLQVLFAVAALVFASWQISQYTSSLEIHLIAVHWPILTLAGVVYVGFYVLLAVHWQFICRQFEPGVSSKQWLAFFAAQPYKYLPSSIFTFTFRAKYAKELGLSFKKSSAAQLVENFSMLTSAAIIALCCWLILYSHWTIAVLFLALGVATFIGCFELIRKTKIKINISIISRITMLSLSALAWILGGLGFLLTANVLGDSIGILGAVGSNAAAVGGGILAVFAPGGLGVRELIYGLFGLSAVAIIAWRLITTIVDVVVGLLAWVAIRHSHNKRLFF